MNVSSCVERDCCVVAGWRRGVQLISRGTRVHVGEWRNRVQMVKLWLGADYPSRGEILVDIKSFLYPVEMFWVNYFVLFILKERVE